MLFQSQSNDTKVPEQITVQAICVLFNVYIHNYRIYLFIYNNILKLCFNNDDKEKK
jgi:hypothetical protein